jgi:hypothetical protein
MMTTMVRPRRNGLARLGALALVLGLSAGCASPPANQTNFPTPEAAAEALVAAAEKHDVATLGAILGPEGKPLITTEDAVQDSNTMVAFAAQAREKMSVVKDPADPKRATLVIGPEEWPVPMPIVRTGGKWYFDVIEGREEVLNRRIGRNELDAIDICHGYVAAQMEYASELRGGSTIYQYAQRIISTPGTQDGLAWLNPDSTWGGPIGLEIARVIMEGYTERIDPYHGYFFKILTGQGPSAPLGELDFKVKDVMIGGFALVAAPAEYGVTGIMTFIVSHDDIVYQKDFGDNTLEAFRTMTRYDPDSTWTAVVEEPTVAETQ